MWMSIVHWLGSYGFTHCNILQTVQFVDINTDSNNLEMIGMIIRVIPLYISMHDAGFWDEWNQTGNCQAQMNDERGSK